MASRFCSHHKHSDRPRPTRRRPQVEQSGRSSSAHVSAMYSSAAPRTAAGSYPSMVMRAWAASRSSSGVNRCRAGRQANRLRNERRAGAGGARRAVAVRMLALSADSLRRLPTMILGLATARAMFAGRSKRSVVGRCSRCGSREPGRSGRRRTIRPGRRGEDRAAHSSCDRRCRRNRDSSLRGAHRATASTRTGCLEAVCVPTSGLAVSLDDHGVGPDLRAAAGAVGIFSPAPDGGSKAGHHDRPVVRSDPPRRPAPVLLAVVTGLPVFRYQQS